MPQQAISFDEVAKQPGAGSSPPPGAIMFDQPGTGTAPQQAPVAKPVPKPQPGTLTKEEEAHLPYYGFTPEHITSAVGKGIMNLVHGTLGTGEHGEGSLPEVGANIEKYLPEFADQANEVRAQAKTAFKRGGAAGTVEGYTRGVFSLIPMLGPWLNDKYTQSMSGDPGGAYTEVATTLLAGKLIEHLNGKIPKVISKAQAVPEALAKDAFGKPEVIAASNQVIQDSADEFKKSIKDNIKKERTGVGDQINQLANADEQARKTAGTRVTYQMQDVAKKIGDAVRGAKAYKSPLTQTNALVKGMVQRYQQGFTWLDLQKFRQSIDAARQQAHGDEFAVLSKVQKDVTKMLSDRTVQLGMGDVFAEYNKKMSDIGKHERGIVKTLDKTVTGLDLFSELASPSNRPILNDLFKVLGRSPTEIDQFIADHGPLVRVAAKAEGSASISGRLQALAQHPLVSGAAGAATLGLPLPGKYIVSLLTMGKAAEIMNRIDAAERLREIREQTSSAGATASVRAPKPTGQPPPSVGTSTVTPPIAPAPTTPSGGFAALGPAPTPATPAPTTASSRIIEAMKSYEAAKQAPPDVGLPPERHAELEAQQNLGRGGKLTSEQAIELDRTELERRSATGEGIPKSETAPKKPTTKAYESFGVTLNPQDWKTPEDVVSGKKAASEQLMSAVNKRAGDIKTRLDSGAIDAKTATALAHELTESWKKAQASIEKTKSTGISRGARDRVSKAGKVKEATAEVGRQQTAAESASGGMDVAEAGIEIDQLDKAFKKAGFGKVYKSIVTKWEDSEHEGDYIELAKQLREGFAGLKKASGQD